MENEGLSSPTEMVLLQQEQDIFPGDKEMLMTQLQMTASTSVLFIHFSTLQAMPIP